MMTADWIDRDRGCGHASAQAASDALIEDWTPKLKLDTGVNIRRGVTSNPGIALRET